MNCGAMVVSFPPQEALRRHSALHTRQATYAEASGKLHLLFLNPQ